MTSYEPVDGPVNILLVEDDDDDVFLIRRAFSKVWLNYELFVVPDGNQALRFLARENPYHDCPTPDLMLLDLNIPRLDGHEVLEAVKSDEDFKQIPVVVLSTTTDEEEMRRSYAAHANSFLTKPDDPAEFNRMVELVVDYWFSSRRPRLQA